MNIGSVKLRNNLVMAPMAGITDMPFRTLAKEGGAALVCTEMVSAAAMAYSDGKTLKLASVSGREHPVSIQIFGSKPEQMAEAAGVCEGIGADIIDINFGCPVRKIVKTGAGAKAVENEQVAARIMESVVKRVRVPVSIKIRTGSTPEENIAPAMVRLAQNCGIKMVAVHARPVSWGHTGKPMLASVQEAVAAAKIPVIGNGGVTDEPSAKDFLVNTGCSGLMIGRAAIGDPWIFGRITHFLETGNRIPAPTMEEKLECLKRHASMACGHYGEKTGMLIMRKVAAYYLKGLPNASRIREKFNRLSKYEELVPLLGEVWESPYFSKAVDFE